MKKNKRSIWGVILFYSPDIIFIVFLFLFNQHVKVKNTGILDYIVIIIFAYIVIRTVMFYYICKYFYFDRVKLIKSIISEFKKGGLTTTVDDISGNDRFARVLRELIMIGRSLDSIVSKQRNEIDTFHDFYDSIVFSISSFFIILTGDEKISYANEGFCKKFKFDQDEIVGKSIEELFYFVNARLKGAILKAKSIQKPVILKQTHLLSISRISIISDIKVSKIKIKDKEQIVIILDDVTSKLRKDYQISFMSHLSESFQSDLKIEKLMYVVLTSVTSGTGLGFNRAMMFLINEKKDHIAGKMAVGPDSFEEAITIWNSIDESDMFEEITDQFIDGELNQFYKKVVNSRFSLNDESNIFVSTLKNKDIIHIVDSWNDDRVGPDIKEFMDVKEFVIAPIISMNNTIGLIIVDNKFNQVPIGYDSIELLKTFASQAALTIESQKSLIQVKKEMQKIEKTQDGIIEAEKMAAVGRLAAHIAHEIRNPLVTMGGYARRIMQMSKMDEVNKINLNKFGAIIRNESERLEKILSNVMDFTKPSRFIKEFNNVNDIIKDTINLLSYLFLERNIEIVPRYKAEIPLIKSDFSQLKQVMLNLLQNAVEATASEGLIEVITDYDSEHVIVKIKDSGSGIDEADPNIVFEPFYTKKISGVGLGLTNVKKIISDHNGDIKVRNREFCGVEFKILLPLLE